MIGRKFRRTLTGVAAAGLALGTVAVLPQPASAAEGSLAPTMFLGDAHIEEGDAGRHVARIPVTLSAPLDGTAHFTVETVDDGKSGATPYEDYQPKRVQKRIAAGKTSTVVTVPILGDVEDESFEAVPVRISALDAPTVAIVKDEGAIFIDDDDSPEEATPTVSVSAARLHEGDSGKRTLPVVFTVPAAQASDVLVTWRTVEDSASAGSDFKHVPTRTTRIKAGSVQRSDRVMLYGDTDAESDEILRVVITGVSGGDGLAISSDPVAGTIMKTDDDTDTDGDLLSDGAESHAKTDPNDPDTDDDGIPDGDEVRRWFTNPNQADTDGDGSDDLNEIKGGTNPLDPADHP